MTELRFRSDTKYRKKFFTPDSFAHPAKMHSQLLIWLVENYTSPGEVILDPMAGMGTTMLACTLGRYVILVELEEKFCNMCKSNWEKVSAMPQLGSEMGGCNIIQGNARNLEGLLADKIITSPPYAEAQSGGGIAQKGYQGPKHSPTDLVGKRSYMPENIGGGENISNLPYGDIEKIITSPPYAEGLKAGQEGFEAMRTLGAVPTNEEKTAKYRTRQAGEAPYSGDPQNIGNKPYGDIDSIITSPPYEGTTGEGKEIGSEGHAVGAFHYGNSSQQIGNLKSDTYLEAMLQVYQQCFKVLKDGGLMILVTKNFIRNKQVVRLDTDTIKLCQEAEFSFVERHRRRLPSQSFWRVIYQKKFPDVEQIKYEDILVFQRA